MKEITKDDIVFESPVVDVYLRSYANVCAPVAVSQALGISFSEAYKRLADVGLKYGLMPNKKRVIYKVLEDKFTGECGPFTTGGEESPRIVTLGDFILDMFNDSYELSEHGYVALISTADGSHRHALYIEGLTIYDGVIDAITGKYRSPVLEKDEKILREFLDHIVDEAFFKKEPNELIYHEPALELFHEVLINNSIRGLFGRFHIAEDYLYNSYRCYYVDGDEHGIPEKVAFTVSDHWIGSLIVRDESLCDELDIDDWYESSDEITLHGFHFKYKQV